MNDKTIKLARKALQFLDDYNSNEQLRTSTLQAVSRMPFGPQAQKIHSYINILGTLSEPLRDLSNQIYRTKSLSPLDKINSFLTKSFQEYKPATRQVSALVDSWEQTQAPTPSQPEPEAKSPDLVAAITSGLAANNSQSSESYSAEEEQPQKEAAPSLGEEIEKDKQQLQQQAKIPFIPEGKGNGVLPQKPAEKTEEKLIRPQRVLSTPITPKPSVLESPTPLWALGPSWDPSLAGEAPKVPIYQTPNQVAQAEPKPKEPWENFKTAFPTRRSRLDNLRDLTQSAKEVSQKAVRGFGRLVQNHPMVSASVFSGVIGGVIGAPFGLGEVGIGVALGGVFPKSVQLGAGKLIGNFTKSGLGAVGGFMGGGSGLGQGLAMKIAGFTPQGRAIMIASLALKNKKKLAYAIAGVVIGIILINTLPSFMLQQALFPPAGVAEAAPYPPAGGGPGGGPGTGGTTIGYIIPIRDTNVTPNTSDSIKQMVNGLCSGQGYGTPHLELWQTLIQTSINNGWNPAFVSALWIEETGAQCPSIYDDAIGCGNDPNKSSPDAQNRLLNYAMPCLNNFFTNWFPSYDNTQFGKFMCYYADGPGGYPACNSSKYSGFSSRIYTWYTRLAGTASIITPTPSPSPTPPENGGYLAWIQQNFGITIDSGFRAEVPQWAYEILNSSLSSAPNFQKMVLQHPGIEFIPTCDISNTSGVKISFRKMGCPGATTQGPTANKQFFKLIFIHELGHVINGSFRPGTYGSQIESAISADGSYLTVYSANATANSDLICGAGDSNTRADEDFAESVAYFINSDTPELSESSECGLLFNPDTNPFKTGKYPNHLKLMESILGNLSN